MVQFGDTLSWTFVMGGLVRDSGSDAANADQVYGRMSREWLLAAEASDMPLDPLLWAESPIASSYPACMAVKAAQEQTVDGGYRYLRRLREGLMCERRKLDHVEALVEEARAVGLDVERFRLGLRSHGITEAFAADLELSAALAESSASAPVGPCSRGHGGVPLPSLVFLPKAAPATAGGGEDAEQATERAMFGLALYEEYRDAALAAGAEPVQSGPLSVEDAVARFGRLSVREAEVICELPGPRAGAELYRLAEQWKLRERRVLMGRLFEGE
jgi:hypothetical protein